MGGGKKERMEDGEEERTKVSGTGMVMVMTLICGRVWTTEGESAACEKKKNKRRRDVNASFAVSVSGLAHPWPRLSQHAVRAPSAVSVRAI